MYGTVIEFSPLYIYALKWCVWFLPCWGILDLTFWSYKVYLWLMAGWLFSRCTGMVFLFNEIDLCDISVYICIGGRHGFDRIVVGFLTTCTYAICAYYHYSCEFESHSGEVYSIQQWTLWDKVCQLLVAGWWFSLGTPVSSTSKTYCHDIIEILLKVALNTITPLHIYVLCMLPDPADMMLLVLEPFLLKSFCILWIV